MKNSNIFFFKQLEQIEKLLVAHDQRVIERLDRIATQLQLLLKDEEKYVSSELEAEVRKANVRALSIDQKVSDT